MPMQLAALQRGRHRMAAASATITDPLRPEAADQALESGFVIVPTEGGLPRGLDMQCGPVPERRERGRDPRLATGRAGGEIGP